MSRQLDSTVRAGDPASAPEVAADAGPAADEGGIFDGDLDLGW